MRFSKKTLISCFLLAGLAKVSAAVIDVPDIGGYKAFQDTDSGYYWLDISNFYGSNQTTDQILSLVSGLGFSLANQADIDGLEASTGSNPTLADIQVMGGNWSSEGGPLPPNASDPRYLVWGVYDADGNSDLDWAWAYGGGAYDALADQTDRSSVSLLSVNDGNADLGVWLVATSVPEPSSSLMIGLGTLGLASARRRKMA